MKANTSTNVRFLVQAAMIAALYTALTLVAIMLNWAFGPVQFRFSEKKPWKSCKIRALPYSA